MFLDDQLIEIGRNVKTDSAENFHKAINALWQACMLNLIKNIKEDTDNQSVIAQFKRVNNTWKLVSKKLAKEGKFFVKPDGFEIILKSMDEWKTIAKAMGL